jgi:hypothetical protein
MYSRGCSQGDAQIWGLEAFILRQASQGDPRALAAINAVLGRAGGQDTVLGMELGPDGVVSMALGEGLAAARHP